MSEREADRSVSQTVRAQLALRDMILSGRLRANERISELQAVEITGVSRTPVRLALVRLEDEGLLQAIPSGGFHSLPGDGCARSSALGCGDRQTDGEADASAARSRASRRGSPSGD